MLLRIDFVFIVPFLASTNKDIIAPVNAASSRGGREEALARDVLGGRNCRITGKETKGRNAGERVRVVRENGFVIGMERGECARLYVGMHLPFACRNAHAHTLQHTYVHVHARIHTHGRARAPYYMR